MADKMKKCPAQKEGECRIRGPVGHQCIHWSGRGLEHPKTHLCPCGKRW